MPDPFPHRLKALRTARGLTLYALGQLSGVDAGLIGRYESGERSPMLAQCVRLAEALECTLDDLAGRAPGETEKETR